MHGCLFAVFQDITDQPVMFLKPHNIVDLPASNVFVVNHVWNIFVAITTDFV